VEVFKPETENYENMLLIEGLITDNPEIKSRVNISRSVQLSGNPSLPDWAVKGANVRVICDDGNEFPFAEIPTGGYEDIDNNLVLETGKYYKLYIEAADGEIYESDYEPYNLPPPIEDIHYTTQTGKISDIDEGVWGVRFYASASSIDDEDIYLRWLLYSTFEYRIEHEANFIWEKGKMEEFSNDSARICWKTSRVPGIFLGSSEGMSEKKVASAPLNFVSQYGDELYIKYSLKAYQLNISKNPYKFWENLNKIVYETGGLYETQPFRVQGNVYCVSDPERAVTGVFEVAGVSDLRIFIERPQDIDIIPFYCSLDTIGNASYPWWMVSEGTIITETESGVFMSAADHCYICDLRGGSLDRPSFWE
jgi:hypothetical protein